MNVSIPNTRRLLTIHVAVFLLIAITVTNFVEVHGQIVVNTRNIANNAITSAKIEDGQVKTPDIANNAVTSSKIASGGVDTTDLADNSVTSDKIVDGSITAADLAPSTGLLGNEKQIAASTVLFDTCSIDFSSVHAHQLVFAFCPVKGARIGDKVLVTNQDLALNLLTQSASVNATDIVRISVLNPNSYSGDPSRITWAMILFRS